MILGFFPLVGVYSDPKCKTLDYWNPHNYGALIVGYGITDDEQKYWTVKNSWGTSWGEKGYIRIAKDSNNMCGVATMVGYPDNVKLVQGYSFQDFED